MKKEDWNEFIEDFKSNKKEYIMQTIMFVLMIAVFFYVMWSIHPAVPFFVLGGISAWVYAEHKADVWYIYGQYYASYRHGNATVEYSEGSKSLTLRYASGGSETVLHPVSTAAYKKLQNSGVKVIVK